MKKPIKLSTIAKALVNDEFIFYYQPIVSLATGEICGAESLIRWRRTDGSIISPGEFIPLAEETGFITEITQQMLPKIVEDLRALNRIDPSLFVTLNVSAKDFADEGFITNLHAATSEKLGKRSNLCIEITETSFLPSDPHTQEILREIDAQGLSIVLNDFTAGFTSFSTLTLLPIKAIKIAMEVTQRAPESKKDFRLFRHLVSMAHQLDLSIIAEGIENGETHDLVASLGCTHTQGYFYARPMPLHDFIELLKKRPRWLEYPFGLEYLAQLDHIDFRRDIIRTAVAVFRNRDEETRKHALSRLPELEADKCLFGKWYLQTESLNAHNEKYIQLGIQHLQFHEIANTLLAKSLNGKDKNEIEEIIVQFSDKSKVIINLLQDLAIDKLKEYYLC